MCPWNRADGMCVKHLKVEKVSDSVYADTSGDGSSNLGAIALTSFVVAVDASMFPLIAQGLRRQVENESRKRFAKLVLTHYHADHVFGNQVFKDCEIVSSMELKEKMVEASKTEWTPKELEKYLESDPSVAGKMRGLEITLPTKTFESSSTIKEKGTQIDIKCVEDTQQTPHISTSLPKKFYSQVT